MFDHVISHYPDFPKPGIDFIDVLPFMHHKEEFRQAIAEIGRLTTAPNVATVEARGFLFAAPLLTQCDHIHTLVPVRKKGKLPHADGDLVKVSIEKEYGSDEVFYRRSDLAQCTPSDGVIEITLFDDLLATGGTALGIAQKLNNEVIGPYRVHVKEFLFIVELPALHGRTLLEPLAPVHSLMQLDGE